MEFKDNVDFVSKLKEINPLPVVHPYLLNIINHYHGLGQGCSCTRNARISNFNNLVAIMDKSLNSEERDFLKLSFQTSNITINGTVLTQL